MVKKFSQLQGIPLLCTARLQGRKGNPLLWTSRLQGTKWTQENPLLCKGNIHSVSFYKERFIRNSTQLFARPKEPVLNFWKIRNKMGK